MISKLEVAGSVPNVEVVCGAKRCLLFIQNLCLCIEQFNINRKIVRYINVFI